MVEYSLNETEEIIKNIKKEVFPEYMEEKEEAIKFLDNLGFFRLTIYLNGTSNYPYPSMEINVQKSVGTYIYTTNNGAKLLSSYDVYNFLETLEVKSVEPLYTKIQL